MSKKMKEPFPVPDVIMDRVIVWAHNGLVQRESDLNAEASQRWINRWERGQLDGELKRAIVATYKRMTAAEREIRR